MQLKSSESMTPLFMTGLFEAAINKALSLDPLAVQSIAIHAGKVLRIKTQAPQLSVYLVFCQDGVQILSHFDGVVDARVQASARQFLLLILGQTDIATTWPALIKVSGDQQWVLELAKLATQLNLWHWLLLLLNEYLPVPLERLDVTQLQQVSGLNWVEHLQQLSHHVGEALQEIRQQNHAQSQLLAELIKMRCAMAQKEKYRGFKIGCGWLFIVLGGLITLGLVDTRLHWPYLGWVLGVIGLSWVWA